MSFKKDHGEHNKNLCDELFKSTKYNDWVLTTAFYSSIHYIDYALFPLIDNGKTFISVDSSCQHFRAHSRHDCRKKLVTKFMASQLDNYNYLDKNCRNARYVNYIVSSSKATQAKEKVELIIKACLAIKP